MLRFHVLNVGHGSSIVVEYEGPDGKVFGVIDSNLRRGEKTPKALTKLQQLGATRLSFLSMTHPHQDHYTGLYPLAQSFNGAVDIFYTCPLGDLFNNRERLKKFAVKLKKIRDMTDGSQRLHAHELIQIIEWATISAKDKKLDWLECAGEANQLAPPGFAGVKIETVLPPARAKGHYIQNIENPNGEILGTPNENELSLAFLFSYGGSNIVLGGDGSLANWTDRRKFEARSKSSLSALAVNLPHHGSSLDCPADVLEQIFAASGNRAGVTSANGISHPSPETILWLEANDIAPYCTNLMPMCGANAQQLLHLANLDPGLARWIREVADNQGAMQPCQGDVLIEIDSGGAMTVTPEFANACAFRGDFSALGITLPKR